MKKSLLRILTVIVFTCLFVSVLAVVFASAAETKTVSDSVEIAVQLCGKLKAVVMMPTGATREEMAALAKADERIAAALAGKTIVKEIVVPGKIVNFVAR